MTGSASAPWAWRATATATATSGSARVDTGRPSTSARVWAQPGERAVPPKNTSEEQAWPVKPSTWGRSQARLWAVPSTIARTRSSRVVSSETFRKPPRA